MEKLYNIRLASKTVGNDSDQLYLEVVIWRDGPAE